MEDFYPVVDEAPERLWTQESVAMVLSDVQMPGMDGLELCRRLRAEHTLADVPVLLISGFHLMQTSWPVCRRGQ